MNNIIEINGTKVTVITYTKEDINKVNLPETFKKILILNEIEKFAFITIDADENITLIDIQQYGRKILNDIYKGENQYIPIFNDVNENYNAGLFFMKSMFSQIKTFDEELFIIGETADILYDSIKYLDLINEKKKDLDIIRSKEYFDKEMKLHNA